MAKKQAHKQQGWEGLLDLCTSFSDSQALERFFDLFLTLEEKEMFIGRYLVIQALLEGELTQREIAKQHRVSIAQITRGSNALKVIDASLKKKLEQHFAEKL
ncbi:MAG: Trp operon repressor [Chlamydiales bacterium]|nr:Trp operon repressor [Chlamydiales bacterium]